MFIFRVHHDVIVAAFAAAPILTIGAPEQPQGKAVAFVDDGTTERC
ncbi:hypothetical protein [Rhodococcus globerulus]|nr:hypothetical protein [Rhodococcus globerulus]MCE4267682.1 hypothetical protein [Rhodococcus globerulus]